jgi:pyrimidine-nucleoside phosphorylase/thymidine phosphorylase
MRTVDLIRRKRDGGQLADGEIHEFVRGLVAGNVADYQAAAMLMAIYFQGLSGRELAALTDAMLRSGDVIDLSDIALPKVDKHSTGGVGDKISIPLAPAVAACGVAVPMISGRGLGHTGGTLDKLESIPGFRTQLDAAEFKKVLRECGLVLAGQSERLVPADRKLYALRDVTGTVESIPLIASSIMSKKLAEGIDGLVLDVKVGRGAFMKDLGHARRLAETLVDIGRTAKKKTVALLTSMDQPLGSAVGNLCEVMESVEVMRGQGPSDIRELTLALGAEMLGVAGIADGRKKIAAALDSGKALECFRRVVRAQGGDDSIFDRTPTYEIDPFQILAWRDGYVSQIDAGAIGVAAVKLGAGRARKEDAINPLASVFLHKKIGDRVKTGDPLCTLYSEHPPGNWLDRSAYEIADELPESKPLILDRIP